MTILRDGSVGIGTETPAELLHVAGVIRSDDSFMVYNGTDEDAVNFTFGNHHGNGYFRVQYLSGNTGDNDLVGKIGMDYDNNSGSQFDNCYIKFYKDGSNTYGGYLTFSTY